MIKLNKMGKENNLIWIVLGIAILLIVILSQASLKKQSDILEEGNIGLNVHYYKDGVEVIPEQGFLGFSVVTPPGESYDQIRFEISGTAQEVPYSDIKIVDATPIAFKNALPTTTQSLSIGETKTLVTSELIDTAQFESLTQPVRFWMKVSGVNDYTELIEYSEGYADLTIESEAPSFGNYTGVSYDVKENYDPTSASLEYAPFSIKVGSSPQANWWVLYTGVTGTSNPDYMERVYKYTSDWTYTGENYYVGLEDKDPADIYFDGTYWWLVGYQTDKVYKYNSNWVYTGTSYDLGDNNYYPISIFYDGSNWWMLGQQDTTTNRPTVYKYNSDWTYTGTSYDLFAEFYIKYGISEGNYDDIYFDGTYWWLVGPGTDKVYKLNSDWTYTEESYYVGSEDDIPKEIFYDGSNWWMLGVANRKIYQYSA